MCAFSKRCWQGQRPASDSWSLDLKRKRGTSGRGCVEEKGMVEWRSGFFSNPGKQVCCAVRSRCLKPNHLRQLFSTDLMCGPSLDTFCKDLHGKLYTHSAVHDGPLFRQSEVFDQLHSRVNQMFARPRGVHYTPACGTHTTNPNYLTQTNGKTWMCS